MKINEFLEKYKKLNTTQSLKNLLEIKSYLSYADKQALANRVLSMCQVTSYGYVKFDETKKYIVFTQKIIESYTNLEFDSDYNVALTEYDALCAAGLLNSIIEMFEGEYKVVLNIVSMRQDYILQDNSVERQVAQFLSDLSDKISVVTDVIANKFESFQDMNISVEDINKLMGAIEKLGK